MTQKENSSSNSFSFFKIKEKEEKREQKSPWACSKAKVLAVQGRFRMKNLTILFSPSLSNL